MQPLKVAVIFDEIVRSGGGYQQAINAALLVMRLPADIVAPVFYSTAVGNLDALRDHGITARALPLPVWRRALIRLRRHFVYPPALRALQKIIGLNALEHTLVNDEIDLVYFLSPTDLARDLERLNYVVTVWDLCHRDAPEFPEVRADRTFEKREAYYRAVLPKAVAVLADSDAGKANIVRRYGVDADRVHVMPFSPGQATLPSGEATGTERADVASQHQPAVPYVFYPAQFWAHKNHVYLLQGLRILEDEFGHRLGAVFSGSDKGNLDYVRRTADELGLADRVRFAGFLPDEEMANVYRQSVALVMPSYFGPTNLPPLEAFALGVPVLYSNLQGLRDQVGDAALLMDLQDAKSMATHLHALLTQDGLRETLVKKGKEQLATQSDSERLSVLRAAFEQFRYRRQCWR